MYVGVLSVVLGQAFWFEAAILFIYAGIGFLLFNAFVFFYESLRSRKNLVQHTSGLSRSGAAMASSLKRDNKRNTSKLDLLRISSIRNLRRQS